VVVGYKSWTFPDQGPAALGCSRQVGHYPRIRVTEAASIPRASGDTRAELSVTTGSLRLSRSSWWLLPLLPILAILPGCGGEHYSESLTYPVRSDPVITKGSKIEMDEPDRPGQLPLSDLKDIQDVRNPYYNQKDVDFIDPKKLKIEDRQELEDVLEEVFGTPAKPLVGLISPEARGALQLHQDVLKEGSRLYRLHCLQCHGLTGDGRGPTAKWVNPHPRDYRNGLFKFQSVNQAKPGFSNSPPRRDDLHRTLIEGVEGTMMQAYNMLPENELNALVSYVIHLSIRGQVELELLKLSSTKDNGSLEFKRLPGGSITGYVKGKKNKGGKVFELGETWRDAQDDSNRITPGEYRINEEVKGELAKSIERGYTIFMGRGPFASDCSSCHIDFGRKGPFKFDEWGTMVKPRNLTEGVFRGGRRPIDIYYRIHSGINGSGMPSHAATMASDQIWDVVNFVRALPYPKMRKDANVVID
jgi:mono/diheme cytochrome c family protein